MPVPIAFNLADEWARESTLGTVDNLPGVKYFPEFSTVPLREFSATEHQFRVVLRNEPIFKGRDAAWTAHVRDLPVNVRQKRALVAFSDAQSFQSALYQSLNQVDRDGGPRAPLPDGACPGNPCIRDSSANRRQRSGSNTTARRCSLLCVASTPPPPRDSLGRMSPKLTQNEREARRRRGVELVQAGSSQAEAAREVGVDPGSVRRWMVLHGMYGERGLRPRPHGGSSKHTEGPRRQFRRVLSLGARKSGYPDDEWDGHRVAAVVLQLFGVHYSTSHAARFLADVPRLVCD